MPRLAISGAFAALLIVQAMPPAQAKTQDECVATVDKIIEAGIITDWKIKGGTIVMIVDEATWKQMDYATKSALASEIDCAIAGPGYLVPEISFRSNMTNNVVGTSENGTLTVEE